MGKKLLEGELTPRQMSHRKSNQRAHNRLLADPEKHEERKQKQREYNARYRRDNPERVEDSRLRSLYGISLKEAVDLAEKQGAVCAICLIPFGAGAMKPFVDHNHVTGKVRGIIHSQCNTWLAVIEDEEFRYAAEQYLEETR